MTLFSTSRYFLIFLLAGFYLCFVDGVSAEKKTGVELVSLETLRAHALSHSPLVARIDASFANDVGTAIETGLLQNPELQGQALYAESYSGMRPDDRYSVSLSQPLRPSDFGTRSAVEQLLKKAATQQQQFELLELSQNVLLQYVNLWALRERKSFVVEMKTLANRKAALAAEGKNKGFLGTSEVKLLQGAAARLKLLELGLRADISDAEAELTQATAFRFSNYRVKRPEFSSVPSLEEALARSKDNKLGIRRRVDLLDQVARRQTDLAKKDSFPGFTPSLLYQHEDNADFIGVGVSFELPFFNRNQGEILRKREKSRELQVQKDYLEGNAFQSELEATLRMTELKYEQAKMYEKEVFPLFRGALKAAERQFESGQTSVLQLWQAFLSLNDANEEQLSLWVSAYGARTKLSLMLGEE